MITQDGGGELVRVTLTLNRVDVELLDQLAALEGSNRSAEVREILTGMRPSIAGVIRAFHAAAKAKEQLQTQLLAATASDLDAIRPDIEAIQQRFVGLVARLEGAEAAREAADPRPSNYGGHNSHPLTSNRSDKGKK